MNNIYTLGYQGCDREAVATKLAELGAVLVDIRYMPYSRAMPEWNRPALEKRFGGAYRHILAFGNKNYNNGGPILIANPEAGKQVILPILKEHPVVLLCTCRDVQRCHRLTVANYLQQELGVAVEHLPTLIKKSGIVQEVPGPAPASGGMKALSIQQPWAWLIVHGHKDIENRSWPTDVRGPVFIHTGKRPDEDYIGGNRWLFSKGEVPAELPTPANINYGGIVGIATIVDCVRKSASRWFCGPYGFVLKDAHPLFFPPLRGQQKFFAVPDEVSKRLLADLGEKSSL